MKVCYLTWGETPRSYGVFGSQVIGQFVETKRQMTKDDFYFISGVPIIHSGLTREKFSYTKELKKVKEKLAGISFSVIPIFAPQNFVNSSKATFPFMHYGSDGLLAKKLKKINPDVVHCRSYHAAYAAIKAKEKQNLSYKIIFDARGLWADEVAFKKQFAEESTNYKFLKSLEIKLLTNADITIGVSDTMVQYYKELGANNVECVYLSADIEKLKVVKHKQKKESVNFGYVGALSSNTWHKPHDLLKLYKKIRKEVKNSKLYIVTTSNHNEIRKVFFEIPKSEIILTSTKTVQELNEVLKILDFGLMSYFKPVDEKEVILSKMVLAVKTAEYVAAGLPMIVNKYCGGASKIVDQYSLGISYDPNTFEEINKENIDKYFNDGKFEQRSTLAKNLFSYESNANKYKNIYEELFNLDS